MTGAEETREELTADELRDAWPCLSPAERVEGLALLPRTEAEDMFLRLEGLDQARVLHALPAPDQRSWLRMLPPDDAADLIQAAPSGERERLLALLDDPTRREVTALLAYAEDRAGGLMSPRFARV